MEEIQFNEFPKMARMSREMIITEKIDGTNAQIFIYPEVLEEMPYDKRGGELGHFLKKEIIAVVDGFTIRAGSRSKWITPKDDNYGFAKWVLANAEDLINLGEGRHFGEWWGNGIQRGYGMKEKIFSLFNVARWDGELRPKCCSIVPTLYKGMFDTTVADNTLNFLREYGSHAAPGFMKPEGIVVWHVAGNFGLKKTIEKDELPKSLAQ